MKKWTILMILLNLTTVLAYIAWIIADTSNFPIWITFAIAMGFGNAMALVMSNTTERLIDLQEHIIFSQLFDSLDKLKPFISKEKDDGNRTEVQSVQPTGVRSS